VVAQLSPEFTAELVDRWRELEAQVATPPEPAATSLPDFTDPAEAAIKFTDQYRRDQQHPVRFAEMNAKDGELQTQPE
jgi:phage regulator Rha-like protein